MFKLKIIFILVSGTSFSLFQPWFTENELAIVALLKKPAHRPEPHFSDVRANALGNESLQHDMAANHSV